MTNQKGEKASNFFDHFYEKMFNVNQEKNNSNFGGFELKAGLRYYHIN